MKKTVLITGGSSGIGLALARKFAADDYDLFLVALEQKELEQAKIALNRDFPNLDIQILCKDLTSIGAVQEVHAYAKLNGFDIDVLVNNAGVGTYGFIDDIDISKEVQMVQLNVLATYQLTRLFLKDMVKRDSGKILNISSVSAFQPNPLLATYGATKAFVHSFSRAINFELQQQQSRVVVLTVCPSPVKDTSFKRVADMEDSKVFDNWMTVTAETVAKDAYQALKDNKELVIPKYRLHLLNKFIGLLPMRWRMSLAWQNLKP